MPESTGARGVWPNHKGNWGRWKNDRGTLNLIDQDAVLRGTKSVVLGRAISCARPIVESNGTGQFGQSPAISHTMTEVSSDDFEAGHMSQSSHDNWTLRTHGMANTHIDALAHMGYRGHTFNGHRFDESVTQGEGALRLDITEVGTLATRGVLVDIAAAYGPTRPGVSITPEQLEPLLDGVLPGDAVVVRAGTPWRTLLEAEPSVRHGEGMTSPWPGLNAASVDLLASRDVSIVMTDTPGDTIPYALGDRVHSPVHILCEVFYGIPLVHNADLESLASELRSAGRRNFLLCLAPLLLKGSTGSLINPVAIV